MESVAWKVKVPIDRNGGVLNFELKEIGIEEFMAVQTFIELKKNREAIIMFFDVTRVGGDEIEALKQELIDKGNIIPYLCCDRIMLDIMRPVGYEVKKT